MNVKFNFSRTTMNVRLANNRLRNQLSRRRLNLEPQRSEKSKTVSQIYKEWNQKNKTDSNQSLTDLETFVRMMLKKQKILSSIAELEKFNAKLEKGY